VNNPGLSAFAVAYTHPKFETILDRDDPDYDPEEEQGEGSDFMPNANFGRWRTPGQSIRVPVHVGPAFQPGEKPGEGGEVIHGELISSEEQDAADRIVHGEHESDQPSANPFVAKAQEDLRTPGSSVSVDTLSSLLNGMHPDSVSSDAMEASHHWLSQHFDGVRVNPNHGTLETTSPSGKQMVTRHRNLPAVPEHEQPAQTFSLTNKHGTFESHDPRRLVRTMMAFEIMHNQFMMEQQKKKDEEDQTNNGLGTTSAFFKGLRNAFMEGYRPHSNATAPHGGIFEPGLGTDKHQGQLGGWVARQEDAPSHWFSRNGVAYSPGHHMNELLDPAKAGKPEPDPYHPGHTYTYIPSGDHNIERRSHGMTYFVNRLHPAVAQGFDEPPAPPEPSTAPAPRAPRGGRMPRTGPTPPAHERPLSLPTGTYPTVDPNFPVDDEDYDWGAVTPQNLDEPLPPHTGAAQVNDLCPVCASGYLEPYDGEHHECLNCGSLVTHVGFEKESATASRKPPRGGLGRGLKQIVDPGASAIGMGLNEDGSVNTDEPVDLDETQTQHPLFGAEVQDPDEVYQAPRRIVGDVQFSRLFSETERDHKLNTLAAEGADPIDEFMGKHGFDSIGHPGSPRVYMKSDPDVEGAYYRLHEGNRGEDGQSTGWQLHLDHVPSHEPWQQGGQEYPGRSIPLERRDKDPRFPAHFRQPLPDPGNRILPNKVLLAQGTHPIEDAALNRAIRDVGKRGRNSQTFWDTFTSKDYTPPDPTHPGITQRDRRALSSVDNPGLTRFVG
jgi:hypothetical protein